MSVITVRGAWDALEADGLIETRAGSGCYVAALSAAERNHRRMAALPRQKPRGWWRRSGEAAKRKRSEIRAQRGLNPNCVRAKSKPSASAKSACGGLN